MVEPIIRGYAILTRGLNLSTIDPSPATLSVSMTAFARAIGAGIADMETILGTLAVKESASRKALEKIDNDMKPTALPSS